MDGSPVRPSVEQEKTTEELQGRRAWEWVMEQWELYPWRGSAVGLIDDYDARMPRPARYAHECHRRSKRRHLLHGGRGGASASPAPGVDWLRTETRTPLCLTHRPSLTLMRVLLDRGISDHAPILADWGVGHQAQRPTWRLNTMYLNSPECGSFVEREHKAFFRCNEGSVDSGATLWTARKPTLCGIIKSYIRGQLEAKIQELE
ncbi:hypothetical protein NDU88_004105 [Pleurodeles waltl]|uniref:Uncharacterized protein n=1 Tax=Pleurodeles waltl TaxID=8319 RepID=A0AAV7M5D6_PLEWA|nr:hypothetical protein NDU88_004105 [Pleurodeles waltl]